MAKSIASINVRIGTRIKELEQGLGKATRLLKKSQRQFSNLGKSMTAAITLPVGGLMAKSLQAYDKQSKAIAQVEAGLRSTNSISGQTAKGLQDIASGLQKITLYGDEEILQGVTAQLLTFTNITNEQFPVAQKAILDVATRLGTDLKSAAIQVGKALNDPVKNLSALSRSGIQFSESQKTLIKSLTETGRIAEAQTIILQELEKQYGGSAEAAAKAGLGPIQQLKNSLGDLTETIGKIVLPFLLKLTSKAQALADKFSSLNESTKKSIVTWALYAAAAGPVLFVISKIIGAFITLRTLFVGLKTTLLTLQLGWQGLNIVMKANPVLAVISAIVGLATAIKIAWDHSQKFRSTIYGLWEVLKMIGKSAKDMFSGFAKAWEHLKNMDFKSAAQAVAKGILPDRDKLGLNVGQRIGMAFAKGFKENVKRENIGKTISDEMKKVEIDTTKASYDLPTVDLPDLPVKAEKVKKKVLDLEELKKEMQAFRPTEFLNKALPLPNFEGHLAVLSKIREKQEEAALALSNFNTQIGSIVESGIGNALGGIAEQIGNVMAGTAKGAAIAGVALGGIAAMLIDLGKLAISTGIAVKGIKAALESLNPIAAIAGGIALIALGSFIRSKASKMGKAGPPKLAKGGVLHGRTMIEAGEYSGARSNPEVIAPLNTLPGLLSKAMGGNMQGGGSLTARISGDDLLILLERANNRQKRFGIG